MTDENNTETTDAEASFLEFQQNWKPKLPSFDMVKPTQPITANATVAPVIANVDPAISLLMPEPVKTTTTWVEIRATRNALIAATDWTMLPDAQISEALKANVVIYRQALRDITGSAVSPDAVVWPTDPIEMAATVKKYGITFGDRSDTNPDTFLANVVSIANTANTANTTSN